MSDNPCFNLLIYLTFVVVLIKVVPVLVSVLREIRFPKATISDFLLSIHLFHKVKLVALLGMLIGSCIVVAGTILESATSLTLIGGSIFFLCLAYSGYYDIRLDQIETKLTAWGGIVTFSIVGFSLLVWSAIILLFS